MPKLPDDLDASSLQSSRSDAAAVAPAESAEPSPPASLSNPVAPDVPVDTSRGNVSELDNSVAPEPPSFMPADTARSDAASPAAPDLPHEVSLFLDSARDNAPDPAVARALFTDELSPANVTFPQDEDDAPPPPPPAVSQAHTINAPNAQLTSTPVRARGSSLDASASDSLLLSPDASLASLGGESPSASFGSPLTSPFQPPAGVPPLDFNRIDSAAAAQPQPQPDPAAQDDQLQAQ
jgi:hypothetical protein